MSFRRFLTQSELEAAVEEAGQELYNYRKDALDAVYIPPDVDNVTDEEDVEDELLPEIDVPGPSDIAGTFELHAFMNEDDAAEIPNKEEAIFLTMMDSILPMMSFWRQKNCDWFLPPCQSHPQLLLCRPSSQSGKRVHWSTLIHPSATKTLTWSI
ncbi:unnamed protein product [Acanthoscelides obtectus]|uniref:Uncharacterized protein n=1 Tax=Acanthoscelides obtectus TaxID=200917 RepID=A0A9P0MK03_ACAOB|nr:unnamed protein product [Acanthoscelides obtectus]CAK1651334.1 hypothetical protein AOBTE_LOCUS17195 [Acanthoscelides obtectus]